MSKITSETTLKELAFIVGKALKDCSINAVLISKHQKIDFSKIKQWYEEEGELEKYEIFLQKLR